ncbi:putative formin-like protein 16 [Iris pallida]|uniref:Formin-like protein 16 n=1 Tax=Iris pallida TaxID=29817 RepID=A0AAX6DWU5_IRIPA|nr:putative formin-like protein 16 [Iris pallida]
MTARPESEATLRTPSSSLSEFEDSPDVPPRYQPVSPVIQLRQVTLRMTSYTIIATMTRFSTLRRYRSRLWRTLILGPLNLMLR